MTNARLEQIRAWATGPHWENRPYSAAIVLELIAEIERLTADLAEEGAGGHQQKYLCLPKCDPADIDSDKYYLVEGPGLALGNAFWERQHYGPIPVTT